MTKTKLKNMNFSDTADIELFDPRDDEPLLAEDGSVQSVTVYGPESDEFKDAKEDMMENRIGKNGLKNLSSKQVKTAQMKMLVAITKSFNGVDFGDGNGLADVKNAKKVYEKHNWLKVQVDDGAGDYANFS